MKKTDLKEIKNLTVKDLSVKAKTIEKDLADLTLAATDKKAAGKDLKLKFKKRKDLAQILTVLRQKQLLEEVTK